MAIKKVREAMEGLSSVDRIMAAHIAASPDCTLKPRSDGRTHFEALARSIVFQQLAGRAASTIWGRVQALTDEPFDPHAVLELPEEALRGAGLSQNKMLSIQDLARHVVDGRLPLDRIARQPDEVVIEKLSAVRGIGRWTTEMFLMFQMCRLDVWPIGDLGVRNGYKVLYGLDELPTVKELAEHGDKFKPWRSVAAWYCWRAADTVVAGNVPRSAD